MLSATAIAVTKQEKSGSYRMLDLLGTCCDAEVYTPWTEHDLATESGPCRSEVQVKAGGYLRDSQAVRKRMLMCRVEGRTGKWPGGW